MMATLLGNGLGVLGFTMPGMYEMMIVLVICLLLFGNRLPSIMRNLGRSAHEFQKGVKDGTPEDEDQKKISDES